MKKYFVILLAIMLPLTWVWAAGEVTKDVVSPDQQEAEWQPEYADNGDLLNPPPAVQMYRNSTPGEYPDPPVITTVLLSEDFEDAGWGDPGTPPPGWTITDNGTEGSQAWYNQDWHKYYYSASAWADTVARVYYSPSNMETDFDEWLITPAVILPGGATACSLTWKNYYNDRTNGSEDSAFVKISNDDGATWTDLAVWDEDHGSSSSPSLENWDITSYAGDTVKIAFVLVCNTGNAYGDVYYWYIDKVNIWADAANLLTEEFNNWGPRGDDPPTNWTILDNGTPKPADLGGWNNNDFHDYTRWSSKTARIYYTSTYREWQDEWMISPSFAISAGALCSLSVVEYYYHSSGGTPWAQDHGYIKITTNGGTSWDVIFDNDATKGSSTTPNTYTYDISSYANNTCQIAFHFVNSPYGFDYWSFDDVNVTEQIMLADDVMTAAINSPTVGISGYSHNVSAQVVNLGTNSATFVDSAVIVRNNQTDHLNEGFSEPEDWTGANPPTGWVVLDSGSVPGWSDYNDWHQYTYTGIWGDIARVYYTGASAIKHTYLITPGMNLTGETEVFLTFRTYFDTYTATDDTAQILGTTDDWVTTQVIDTWITDRGTSTVPHVPVYDISSWAADSSNVKIAFRLYSTSSEIWRLDDVNVYSPLAPTTVYQSEETVTGLASLESRAVDYATAWNSPTAGSYTVTSFTNLVGDGDNSNDTLSSGLTVYEHYETGGPDAGNYSWASDKDGGGGDPYSWIDITTSGTPVTWDGGTIDNQYTYGIPLGFSFTFYDNAYDRIYLSMNGYASFDTITSTLSSNYHLPSTLGQDNLLALLWDDLSYENEGAAYYYTNNVDSFIVSYENWNFDLDTLQRIDMQLILTAGDRGIKYQYKEVGPVVLTSHSIGIEDDPGNVGLEFVYNGTPIGNIAMSGLAITFGYNPPSIDAAMSSIDEPADGAVVFNGSTVTPTVTVINNSDDPYSIDVTYIITDGVGDTVYNQTEATASVPGLGGSAQHAFATTWLADPDGDYDVEAFVTLAGDGNPANDTEFSDFEVGTHYGAGGPDDFGYRWIDNSGITAEDPPVFSWIELSTSPTADTAGTSSGNLGHHPIGFDFKFYGTTYDSVYINGYGMLQFGDYFSSSASDCPVPSSSTPNMPFIGGFWDYGYPSGSYDGATIYETFGTAPDRHMVVQYHNHRRGALYTNEWEVILHENGNIVVQYLNVTDSPTGHGSTAMVGLEDWDNSATGLGYLCDNSPIGNTITDGLAIKFYKPVFGHDVVAEEFIVPGLGVTINEPFTPEVLFINNGTNGETNVPVSLTIDPGAYSDAQVIAVLDSGTSASQQFAAFTPTVSGTYTLTAVSALVGDEDPASDTLVMQITAYDQFIDFEADNGGLAGSGDWEWGTPSGTSPDAYSGVNCWGTVLSGIYPAVASISDLDFQVNITGAGAQIDFMEWRDMSSSSGYARIFADSGNGYELLDQRQGFVRSWEPYSIDLSAYSGFVNIRLQFEHSTYVYTYVGWYIDDLALAGCVVVTSDIDVTPLALSGEADPGLADADTLTISNSGDGTLNYRVSPYQDPSVTLFDGTVEPLYETGDFTVDRQLAGYHPVEEKLRGEDLAENEQGEPYFLPVPLSVGGPDAFGYTWIDSDELGGPTFGWVDISTVGTLIPLGDDTNLGPYALGFGFNYYGVWFTDIRVASNGFATFTSASGTLTNSAIPATGEPNNTLPIFWDDLAPHNAGAVYYYADTANDRFIISYDGVPHYSNTGSLYFQIILNADNTILYQYNTMDHAGHTVSATIGIENGDGTIGLEYDYNTNPPAIHDSLAILFEGPPIWLSADVYSGSILPAGPSDQVEISMDALELTAGIYTGRVEITSNDPDETVVNVPVTFIVGGIGSVAGQVTDANDATPIEGAVVTATLVSATTVVDTTDASGNYSIDIPPGTVSVTVEAAGYESDTQDVTVVEDQTTTHNVALGAPLASIDTSPVIDNVAPGDTNVYTRVLTNTGTAPLNYNVILSYPSGNLLLDIGIGERINQEFNLDSEADFDPHFDYGSTPIITVMGDSLFAFDPENLTGDDGCLGIEFDGTYFWVTGRNDGIDDVHKLHKFDRDGVWIASYDQGTSSTWGWRDMAWDGTYLYAGDENELAKIDPATGLKIGTMTWPPALPVARALAYDSDNDIFYAANWTSDIYGFTSAGVVVDTIPNLLSIYGLAYDNESEGGPYLWSFSGGANLLVSQIDIAGDSLTGVSFYATPPGGYTAIIGGMCITNEWNPRYNAVFVLGQGTPTDYVAGYELAERDLWISVQANGSGVIDPSNSATIEFMVDFRDSTIVVDSTYEADANISNNSAGATPVIPFSITAAAAGCDYVIGDVNGSDSYNGLDITYGVAFFKGGNAPLCDECPLCSGWWYCGDVNGSCSYNGLDITYGVAYFKGGNDPIPCADCPPLGGPASVIKGNDIKPSEFKPITIPTFDSKSKSKKGTSLKR